jgi:Zn-finger nucleic acid-binding protein
MPFRDRPPRCPRCTIDLDPAGDVRWRCTRCQGVLVRDADVAAALLDAAPDLQPEGRIRDVSTPGRGRATPLPCALCAEAMEPGFLGGVEIERCRRDGVFWFDHDELEGVLARARAQRVGRRGLLERLRALLGR